MIKLRMVIFCALALALPAQAEIYKHVDDKGRVTYSNVPIKGGQKVILEPLSVVPPPISPETKAAVKTAEEQKKKAKQAKREALEAEIAAEGKQLDQAKLALKAALENPEVMDAPVETKIEGPSGTVTLPGTTKPRPGEAPKVTVRETPRGKETSKTVKRRGVSRYNEKIKQLEEEVARHEKNLTALKKELADL